jgi:transposase
MLSLSLPGRVFLCTLPTDMRKSFDSLAGLVEQQLGQDPLAGDLFVFRSRRGDRLKLLYWDSDGLAIWLQATRGRDVRVSGGGPATCSRGHARTGNSARGVGDASGRH